ncbi:uncharacterized protein QC763_700540 [Podospora pseudopauciseta]|uniref:T6SS Phospholipase effector Tle1-like catalytic domain-containing protein n=1 Tax=Podospora pseudopauciseta TaxID=2093780 RepID=A0ABR0H369_9PEZI|nr:hypothetical protein QC763_700540 [Podospora pseudopauciseta]
MASPLDPAHPHRRGTPKRLIVCCDGTWMNSLGKKGYEPPSNVTRISRVLCRTCSDGRPQIINYFAGVGTANGLDQFTGGAFGMGLDADIREVYNFLCTNYVDGDDIILIGFSRGAFTARSVADMVASVGLLTPEGLDKFFAIFDDYENMGSSSRDTDDFLIDGLEEYKGQHGQKKIEWEERRKETYKRGLREKKLTRDTFHAGAGEIGEEIKIKALAVWDTVGTLGIPPAPVIGVRGSADQWRFTNTQISAKVENAFQALALDEPRYAFRPALWERVPGSTTNLKQVWFPGNHGNVGGGWWDQQISDITLAWMCDQLSTLGLEFNHPRMTNMFLESLRFSAAHPFPFSPQSKTSSIGSVAKSIIPRSMSKLLRGGRSSSSNGTTNGNGTANGSASLAPGSPKPWGHAAVFRHPFSAPKRDPHECDGKHDHPDGPLPQLWQFARPWGLGLIRSPTSVVTTVAGKTVRRPGLFMRVDEDTNEDTSEPLLGTSERIHACVRIRLACGGLGLDDKDVWTCDSLLKSETAEEGDKRRKGGPLWKLERGSALSSGEEEFVKAWRIRPRELTLGTDEYPERCMYPVGEFDHHWKWVYQRKAVGEGQARVPQEVALPEEPLVGYWERYLLALLVGEADVWRFAQQEIVNGK